MFWLLRDIRWASTASDQYRKPKCENRTLLFWDHALLLHAYVNLLDHIPHKTTAVPLFLALRLSYRICRASHQSILPTAHSSPRPPPASPRILSDFRVQSGIRPRGPAIRRHLNSSNPVTGVESNTLDFSWHSGMQSFVGVGTHEYRTHVESIDGNCVLGQIFWRFGAIGVAGNAIRIVRPEVAEGLRQHGDVAESFHPISSIPTRHNEAEGEAVHHGQRLVIHGVGDHHLSIPRVVDRKGLHEVRHRRQWRRVKPIEGDVHGAGLHLRTIQNRLHGNAGPFGVADCAMLPLATGNAGLEETARIAGTLIDGDDADWLELRSKFIHA